MQYRLVCEWDAHTFEQEVNKLLSEGWRPFSILMLTADEDGRITRLVREFTLDEPNLELAPN